MCTVWYLLSAKRSSSAYVFPTRLALFNAICSSREEYRNMLLWWGVSIATRVYDMNYEIFRRYRMWIATSDSVRSQWQGFPESCATVRYQLGWGHRWIQPNGRGIFWVSADRPERCVKMIFAKSQCFSDTKYFHFPFLFSKRSFENTNQFVIRILWKTPNIPR